MIGDVSLGQASPLFPVPRVDTLVRGQMPGVQRCMLFDMAVFDSRVLRDVPRSGFRARHSLVHHNGHFPLSSRPTTRALTLLRTHGHQSVITKLGEYADPLPIVMLSKLNVGHSSRGQPQCGFG
jgi:hypothetical protein